MSVETEVESINSPEIPMKRSNSISLNDNPEVKDLIKIPYVKELLVKLDVLKNGIINERKKNKENESQIKQLESELNSKSSQIKDLTEAKSDLEKQLEIEKKKLAKKEEGFLRMASLLNSSSQNSGKFCVNPSKSLENVEEIDESEKKIEKKKVKKN